MTDKELLELAAKAAGWPNTEFDNVRGCEEVRYGMSEALYVPELDRYWNPLVNDGDALRLAVKLEIAITFGRLGKKHVRAEKTTFHHEFDFVWPKSVEAYELLEEDTGAATRRAIVRAAAEIGKNMQ